MEIKECMFISVLRHFVLTLVKIASFQRFNRSEDLSNEVWFEGAKLEFSDGSPDWLFWMIFRTLSLWFRTFYLFMMKTNIRIIQIEGKTRQYYTFLIFNWSLLHLKHFSSSLIAEYLKWIRFRRRYLGILLSLQAFRQLCLHIVARIKELRVRGKGTN